MMKLNDLRRFAVRRQARVRFHMLNGMDCVIDEHGISRTPGLSAPPDFNAEDELGKAKEFTVEWAAQPKSRPQAMTREQLEKAIAEVGAHPVAAHDHEE
jgi:hypothetical protein